MQDLIEERPLFGGALASKFPLRFEDMSYWMEVSVPNNQEAFADCNRDESLIFELLEYKDLPDFQSARWFLEDLAREQADYCRVIETSEVHLQEISANDRFPVSYAVGEMAISKGRQGREAQNIVKVFLANIRLKNVSTDVLIVAYEPIIVNPLSESAAVVGAGLAKDANQIGLFPVSKVFECAVSNFRVLDWALWGDLPCPENS